MFLQLILFLSLAYYSTALECMCYYESWSFYSGITPEHLDPSLCTFVNYAFGSLNDDGQLRVVDENLDIKKKLYERVVALKKKNRNLKVCLSIGGADPKAAKAFSGVAANAGRRKVFINSCVRHLRKYGFNCLDIDWETPQAGDKGNFITLLRDLKTELKKHRWFLTAAVTASPGNGYDVRKMAQHLDWFNVMTYDMYGPWSSYTGQNSALFPSSVESDWEKKHLNLAACANLWVQAGAPKKKISLGIAFYGRSWVLADPKKHGIHAPVTKQPGVGNGRLLYSDICLNYKSWTRVWDNQQKNPYKYKGTGWFSYDDKDSVLAKAKYIKQNGYGGAMIWAINQDDVMGKCGPKQQLLKQVKSGLK